MLSVFLVNKDVYWYINIDFGIGIDDTSGEYRFLTSLGIGQPSGLHQASDRSQTARSTRPLSQHPGLPRYCIGAHLIFAPQPYDVTTSMRRIHIRWEIGGESIPGICVRACLRTCGPSIRSDVTDHTRHYISGHRKISAVWFPRRLSASLSLSVCLSVSVSLCVLFFRAVVSDLVYCRSFCDCPIFNESTWFVITSKLHGNVSNF